MKSDPRCVPCMFNQVLTGAKHAGADQKVTLDAYNALAKLLPDMSLDDSPAWLSYLALKAANEVTGCPDPYKSEKTKYNQIAMELFPKLEEIVKDSNDELYAALKVAVTGNIIDLGILESFDIDESLDVVMREGFAIDHYEDFKRELSTAENVLYLLDNAGEVVFDMVLMDRLRDKKVTAVVNRGPIINDVTMEDAKAVGLDVKLKVISSGTDTIGKIPEKGSGEYREAFEKADMIIAKGHGNYETLDGKDANIFFILKAKCDVVAESLGVKLGEVVLKWRRG